MCREENKIDRPFCWLAGAYVLGEVLCLSRWSIWAVLPVTAAVLVVIWKKRNNRQCWLWLALPVFFVWGYCCCNHTLLQREAQLSLCAETETSGDKTKKGKKVIAEGDVGKVTERERRTEVLLEKTDLVTGGKRTENIGRLLVYLPVGVSVAEGDRIRVKGFLSKPDEATNPGQFDYSAYEAALGVNLVLEGTGQVIRSGARSMDGLLGKLRRCCVGVLLKIGGAAGGTMAALALGDKSALPEERYQLYLDSGIGHILTLSGLHLSLFGVGLYGIMRKRLTIPQWPASGLTVGLICAYVRLTGSGISAQRAAAALTVSLLGGCLGKTYDLLSAAGLGMLWILTRYPLQITRPSFWLSFCAVFAVGGILPALNQWIKPRTKGMKAVLAVLSIQLAVMPVSAVNQYTLQPYGILLNLVVVPMMGTLLGGSMAVLAVGMIWPSAAAVLALPVSAVFAGIDGLCRFSLCLPGGTVVSGCPSSVRLAVYGLLLGGFMFVVHRENRLDWEAMETAEYPERIFEDRQRKKKEKSQEKSQERNQGKSQEKNQEKSQEKNQEKSQVKKKTGRRQFIRRRVRLLTVFVLLAGVLSVRIGGRTLVVTFLDVGQGDCICIETPNHTTILVDGGSSSASQVGEYRIRPWLEWAGIDHLDYLVLTHMDEDHVNGAKELLYEGFPVGILVISAASTDEDKVEEIYNIAEENSIKVVELNEEDKIISNKVEIDCLHPMKNSRYGSENEASVVLLLSYENFSCLLTGDLEGEGEERVREYLEEENGITLLKVAHHGSKYSTSEEFLEAAHPAAAVISCGRNNRYGHPHEELLDRLDDAGCRVYSTAESGAVTVETDGIRWRIRTYLERKTTD